jgi:hypothetical protein
LIDVVVVSMVTYAILKFFMFVLNSILAIVWTMGEAVFSIVDVLSNGSFSASIPMLDAFVDVNVLQGAIGTVLSVYAAFWSAFIVNWIIKRVRGG